ncbi:MAG: hypothetical protein ACI4D7_06580 [Lachnospiraceae bacterium]
MKEKKKGGGAPVFRRSTMKVPTFQLIPIRFYDPDDRKSLIFQENLMPF